MKPCLEPFLLGRGGAVVAATPLPRLHHATDDRFLQDVSLDYPNLLLVERFGSSVRDLFCLACQIPAPDDGAKSDLFISAGDYVVAAERRFLRNLQAWVELAFEFLACIKNSVARDSYWREAGWRPQCPQRGITSSALVKALDRLGEDLNKQDNFEQQQGNQ